MFRKQTGGYLISNRTRKVVCQAPESTKLVSDYVEAQKNPVDFARLDETKARILRSRILGEVEAFYIMQLGYNSWVKQSSMLCQEPHDKTFFETYLESEAQLLAGSFAQVIIQDYEDVYKGNKRYILDLDSPFKEYAVPGLKKFSQQKLHPDLRKGIEKLGIPISD